MAAVKSWVINLERSRDRRAHLERQLADHLSGLEHEFVVAVDGRSLGAMERADLVDEKAVARAPWWLTPGAIGAALSHRAVCQRIAAGEHPIGLVLEDDVVLSQNVERIVTEAADQMASADVVLVNFRSFEPCRFARTGAVRLSDGRYLAHPVDAGQPISAGAYLITREAAKRLAGIVLPVRVTADSWRYLRDAGGFDQLRCIVPCPIRVDPHFRTTLDYVPGTLRASALDVVARYRLPPFHQAMRVWRAGRLRRWSRHVFVDPA